MTLAEVAARIRHEHRDVHETGEQLGDVERLVREFEADPDFKLRERTEALAKAWESASAGFPPDAFLDDYSTRAAARRLREVLGGKP